MEVEIEEDIDEISSDEENLEEMSDNSDDEDLQAEVEEEPTEELDEQFEFLDQAEAEAAEEENDDEATLMEDDHHHHSGCATNLFQSPILNQALYPEATIILKDTLLMLLDWQIQNEISQSAFVMSLQLLGYVLLPKKNLLPTSIYRLNKLIGFDISDYEEHVCEDDCHLFEKAPKTDWKGRVDEKCPHCGTSRFKQSGKNTIAPRKKFYRIPISEQLEQLTVNPEFVPSLERMKEKLSQNLQPTDSFWGGASLVSSDVQDPTFHRRFKSLFFFFFLSLGIDGVKVFKESDYSVQIVCFKIWNLAPENRTTRDFTFLSILIPGPKKPKSFNPYLLAAINDILSSYQEISNLSRNYSYIKYLMREIQFVSFLGKGKTMSSMQKKSSS